MYMYAQFNIYPMRTRALMISYLSMDIGLVVYEKLHSASLPSSGGTMQGSLVTVSSINL